MTEDEFTHYLGSALAAMKGVAESISVVGHIVHLRNASSTHWRIAGACCRDTICILDSLARDRYRNGGLYGIGKYLIGISRTGSKEWAHCTFAPAKEQLVIVHGRFPKTTFAKVEKARKESTAHIPIYGKVSPQELSVDELWEAYKWLKAMLIVFLTCLDTPAGWPINEQEVSENVEIALSKGLLPARSLPSKLK